MELLFPLLTETTLHLCCPRCLIKNLNIHWKHKDDSYLHIKPRSFDTSVEFRISLSNLPFIFFCQLTPNYIHMHHLISPFPQPCKASRKRHHCPHLAGDLGLLTVQGHRAIRDSTRPRNQARYMQHTFLPPPFMPPQTYIIRLLGCDDCSGCFLNPFEVATFWAAAPFSISLFSALSYFPVCFHFIFSLLLVSLRWSWGTGTSFYTISVLVL